MLFLAESINYQYIEILKLSFLFIGNKTGIGDIAKIAYSVTQNR